MLLFVALQIGMTLLAPMLMEFAQSSVQEAQAKAEASRKQQIDALKADEAEAKTEEEKEQNRGQIKAIEAQPLPAGPDMKALMGQMDSPVIRAYTWTDMVHGPHPERPDAGLGDRAAPAEGAGAAAGDLGRPG